MKNTENQKKNGRPLWRPLGGHCGGHWEATGRPGRPLDWEATGRPLFYRPKKKLDSSVHLWSALALLFMGPGAYKRLFPYPLTQCCVNWGYCMACQLTQTTRNDRSRCTQATSKFLEVCRVIVSAGKNEQHCVTKLCIPDYEDHLPNKKLDISPHP